MKRVSILPSIILVLSMSMFFLTSGLAQQEPTLDDKDFKIGVVTSGDLYFSVDSGHILTSKYNSNGTYSSMYGVFAEDGVNIVRTWEPVTDATIGLAGGRPFGRNKDDFKRILKLFGNNGMRVMLYQEFWAKHNSQSSQFSVDFDLDTEDTYFMNYLQLWDEVLQISPFKEIVWGANIIGEYQINSPYPEPHCRPAAGSWIHDTPCFGSGLIPPSVADQGFQYFNNLYTNSNIKTLNNPGAHNSKFNAYEKNILNLDNRGDICYEAGYSPTQFDVYRLLTPNNDRILWKYDNIDYAYPRFSEVHTELDVTSWDSNFTSISDDVENWNYVWFKTYMGIIHKVRGVWFHNPVDMFETEVENEGFTQDKERKDKLKAKDFDRSNFPESYQKFLSHLIKELAYLKDNGFLDKSSIIATKTDHTDYYGVLNLCSSYIPERFTNSNSLAYFNRMRWGYTGNVLNQNYTNERFGIQYSVRTNGTETIIILANPNPIVLKDVELNFCSMANPVIQNSVGVDVLFNDNALSSDDVNYKSNRNSFIGNGNTVVGKKYYLPFTGGKRITIDFGPLDVIVLKFRSDTPVSYSNGWDKEWSNEGSGTMGDWWFTEDDVFYSGDFDGDGIEELLCSQTNGYQWMSVLKYQNQGWNLEWTNNGVPNTMSAFRENFVVGDFDGDGSDELLGVSNNGQMAMFKYQIGGFVKIWQSSMNSQMLAYLNNWAVGDFDNNGKDELFSCDGNLISAKLFEYNNVDFVSKWYSGYGHSIMPYLSKVKTGDFNGDGRDDLIGMGYLAKLFHYTGNDFVGSWVMQNSNSFGGWSYPIPLSDFMLVGDIDQKDIKDEIFFLQTGNNNSWAVTMDLKPNISGWNWNWDANNTVSSIPYINDWSIDDQGGHGTSYFLIKLKKNEPKYLFCKRQFDCGGWGHTVIASVYKSTLLNNKKELNDFNVDLEMNNSDLLFASPNPIINRYNCKVNIPNHDFSIYDLNGHIVQKGVTGGYGEIKLSRNLNGMYVLMVGKNRCRLMIMSE